MVALLMFGLVAAGLYFRSRGIWFEKLGFWLDECSWGMLAFDLPLREQTIRPPAFMALTRAVASIFPPTETTLRALPWLAGVASTLMAPWLAFRLLTSHAARLLFVACVALHPLAIDLAKEFKPYSVSLALHFLLLLLCLRYVRTQKTRDLLLLLGVSGPAVLFAQDVAFAYPGVFLVSGIEAFRARRIRHMQLIFGAGVLTVGICIGLYFFMFSAVDPSAESDYWGGKYDVFYVEGRGHSVKAQVGWLLQKYGDVASLPGMRSTLWETREARWATLSEWELHQLKFLDRALWIALHVLGIVVIAVRRSWVLALLLLLPVSLVVLANIAKIWPFGTFRTNLFVLAYMVAIAAVGIDDRSPRVRVSSAVLALALVLLPLFAFEKHWHSVKRFGGVNSFFPQFLERMIAQQGKDYAGPPQLLILDYASCTYWQYYTAYNATVSRELGPELARRFKARCASDPRQLRRLALVAMRKKQAPPAWVLFSKQRTKHYARRTWMREVRVSNVVTLSPQTAFEIRPRQ